MIRRIAKEAETRQVGTAGEVRAAAATVTQGEGAA